MVCKPAYMLKEDVLDPQINKLQVMFSKLKTRLAWAENRNL